MELELCVIVPLTRMSGRLTEISSWLRKIPDRALKVIIVHDLQDQETSSELKILVDSCSDSRICLLEGHFGSPGMARNHGFTNSNSKWVIFVDSDDVVDLAQVFSMIDLHDGVSEVLVGSYEVCDLSSAKVFKTKSNSDALLDIAINPGIWRMVFLRSTIADIRFCASLMGEDQIFLLDFGIFCKKIQFFDNVVYKYFRNSKNQLTKNSEAISQIKTVITQTLFFLRNAGQNQNHYVSMMLLRQLLTHYKNESRKGFKDGLRAIRLIFTDLDFKSCFHLFRAIAQLARHKAING
jgi:glycosyltransferase involved in cell wall biosynthesis